MNTRAFFFTGIAFVGIVIGVLFGMTFFPSRPPGRQPSEPIMLPIAIQPNELLTSAFDVKMSWSIPSSTRILLMPHHIVPAKEIASLLTSVQQPSVVYYVAPDHFSRGPTGVTTLNAAFTNENGSIRTDEERMRRLQQLLPQLREDEGVFRQEPASLKPLPFIAHARKGVSIVPILVRPSLSIASRQARILTSMHHPKVKNRSGTYHWTVCKDVLCAFLSVSVSSCISLAISP